MSASAETRLQHVLTGESAWVIAISGGVDSMTLATIAHRALPGRVRMVHASSPAVPSGAKRVIEEAAAREGWALELIDAGELADERYRANPVNRCYFCKSNLYAGVLRALAGAAGGKIASGANTDDLGDYRPGLKAAAEHGVRHPFIEAKIGKAEIRAIARAHDLPFAELPAQPCLASRMETGLRIEPAALSFIDRLENRLRDLSGPEAVLRARVRREGVVIETDAPATLHPDLRTAALTLCAEAGRRFAGVEDYQRGSAFIHERE